MKKNIIIFLLSLVFFAATWSLFTPQFFRVHDYTHAARISEMTRAMEDGHFPVRWTKNFGYGYGMPLFEFYAPLPYYVGSFFYWVSNDVVLSIKLLFIICTLGTIIGSYKLGKSLFQNSSTDTREMVGVLTAAAITLAPYRAVNLYVRGALSEAWAIMALPWILYSLISVISRKKNSWVVLVISLMVLFLSHNLTTMLFVPLSMLFFALYGVVSILNKKSKYVLKGKLNNKNILNTILVTSGSYILALCMSAFYLIPTFLEKDFTKVEQYVLDTYFNFRLHFLYIRQFFKPNWGFGGSGWGVDDDISFFLGYGQLIAIVIAGSLLLREINEWYKKKNRPSPTKIILISGSGLLLFISLFMSLLKSQPVWEVLPLLEFVQFPWRWLSISIVFLGILAGSSVVLFKSKKVQFRFLLSMVAIILFGNFYYFKPEVYLEKSSDYYYTEEQKIAEAMSDILQDYIPAQMPKELVPPESIIDSSEKYEVIIDRTHEKLIRTNFKEDQDVAFNIANFPGWYIEIDGKKVESVTSEEGLIKFSAPKDSHLVAAIFGYTDLRKASDIISTISIVVFFGLLLDVKKPRLNE